jgi:hypothetical protein
MDNVQKRDICTNVPSSQTFKSYQTFLFYSPGGGRYSSPQCVNFGGIGDFCRPYGTEPFNTTVGYPNGYSVTLTNVYYVLCVCASGLVCDRSSSTCQEPEALTHNSIH